MYNVQVDAWGEIEVPVSHAGHFQALPDVAGAHSKICVSSCFLLGGGDSGGSPTVIQAWRPCPLWEPSPSHAIVLLYTRRFSVFFCMCVCLLCFLCIFVFLQYFDAVGWVF